MVVEPPRQFYSVPAFHDRFVGTSAFDLHIPKGWDVWTFAGVRYEWRFGRLYAFDERGHQWRLQQGVWMPWERERVG